ncbi:hypothetical protein HWV62_357 [Athelia sp. TMB]|nr:hypothetical protein HWV62_357 [Athelia sp. TMB]
MERPPKKARVDSKRRPAAAADKKSQKPKPAPAVRGKGTEKTIKIDGKAALPSQSQALAKSKQKGKGKARAEDTPSVPPRSFKIVTGSYEKLLYGLAGTIAADSESSHGYTVSLTATFIFPAHVSCIKAVAASPGGGKWLATGSADEIIKVWDLRRRKEVGGLMHHEGSITHLTFPTRSHLLSASDDGTLALFRARDWAVLRVLKGHRGRVNALAVHPSSKVALSVGHDATLRMWDLMRGKGCASTKLGKEGERVVWSTGGGVFAVQAGKGVDVYDTKMRLLHAITAGSRLHDVAFTRHPRTGADLLLAGGEDGRVVVYALSPPAAPADDDEAEEQETPAPRIIAHLTGHANRVKAIDVLAVSLPPSSKAKSATTMLICTASSDGHVRVFDLADLPAEENEGEKTEVGACADYDSGGTRLTCVAFAEGDVDAEAEAGVKRRRSEEVSDDEGDEEEWGGVGEVENEDEDEAEVEGEEDDATDEED